MGICSEIGTQFKSHLTYFFLLFLHDILNTNEMKHLTCKNLKESYFSALKVCKGLLNFEFPSQPKKADVEKYQNGILNFSSQYITLF